jgi:sugar phosphate isomerase/epimerase
MGGAVAVRPVTLFTGQWADLPLADLAARCSHWGYDGLELACWGDHFDVGRAISESGYVAERRALLERHGLRCWAIGAHLVGQAVCDPIDARHRAVLPAQVWGNGEPNEVRARAASWMKDAARAAADFGVEIVTGFTGSPIWHLVYSFPPNDWASISAGYDEFAALWGPIIDVFEAEGVRFALEVHPTEIAYDFVTTRRALEAIGSRPGFALNLDPSHFIPQFLDPAAFAIEFRDWIAHVHVKDAKRRLDGRQSILGSHLDFDALDRGWTFVSPGRGDVDFDELVRALNRVGYDGPLSVEWEDPTMEREWGAREARAFVREIDFPSARSMFDTAFSS